MSQVIHRPVLVKEVVEILLAKGDAGIFIDCTVGTGGHSEALLEASEGNLQLFGIDRDISSLDFAERRLERFTHLTFKQANFSEIDSVLEGWDIMEVDGILADFGQSTFQIEDASRGFAYMKDGPLDMRYDQSIGLTAAEWINSAKTHAMISLFKDVGQERYAKRIANRVYQDRPIQTTEQLANIIRAVCPQNHINKTMSRIFMALRVIVNDELTAIDKFMEASVRFLKSGGRLVAISFDSNQDRRVKEFFRLKSSNCVCPPSFPLCICEVTPQLKILTTKAVTPTKSEISSNSRSRSAKLRAAEKL